MVLDDFEPVDPSRDTVTVKRYCSQLCIEITRPSP